MRVLVVKTSSLGDVVHTLPALTDATRADEGMRFDWVIEEAFAEIPQWHPAVERVIPVAVRRWRRKPLGCDTREAWRAYQDALTRRAYDRVIDAQGLLKSAVLARFSRGPRCGMDWSSAREPLASLLYGRRFHVPREAHAIERTRQLFAHALGYQVPRERPDYGIRSRHWPRPAYAGGARRYLVFLHGTTWVSKCWPEEYWRELARHASGAGFDVYLPVGNEADAQRALRIADGIEDVRVLPRQDLAGVAALLASASGVAGVDTGLSHLAAALEVPSVTIYGATSAALTGTCGRDQLHALAAFSCAPCMRRDCSYRGPGCVRPACYQTVRPERVWTMLESVLAKQA